jgi:hypothetical protein
VATFRVLPSQLRRDINKSSNHWNGSKIHRRLGIEKSSALELRRPKFIAHPRSKASRSLCSGVVLVGTARDDPQSLIGLALLARGIVPLIFAADLLRSFFVSRLFLPALVAYDALIGRGGRSPWHSRLPAMLAALVLRTL